MIDIGAVADLAAALRAAGVTRAHFSLDGQVLELHLEPRSEETKQTTATAAPGKEPKPIDVEALLFASSVG